MDVLAESFHLRTRCNHLAILLFRRFEALAETKQKPENVKNEEIKRKTQKNKWGGMKAEEGWTIESLGCMGNDSTANIEQTVQTHAL